MGRIVDESQRAEFLQLAEALATALKDHFLARDLDASGEALDRMESIHNQILAKFGPDAAKRADAYANAKGHEMAAPHLDSTP